MRYIRKKRLVQQFVGCFLITYICFIFFNITQYNINEENDISQEDIAIPDIPEIPDIPIIREKVSGSL